MHPSLITLDFVKAIQQERIDAAARHGKTKRPVQKRKRKLTTTLTSGRRQNQAANKAVAPRQPSSRVWQPNRRV